MLKKIAFCTVIGNALEIYDFTLYGFFSPLFAILFFPKERPFVALLASFTIFASGFLMRAIGSLFFGYMGDKYGRKKALSFSILVTGLSTFGVSILPTYETLGLLSPLLLACLRLIQGFCMGGEYNGAAIFLTEHYTSQGKKGFAGALVTASGSPGALIGIIVSFFMLHEAFLGAYEWSWRIPFVLGGCLSFLGYYMRIKLQESPEFRKKEETTFKNPIRVVLSRYPKSLLVSMIIGACQGALVFFLYVYAAIYLKSTWQVPADILFLASSLGLITHVICLLISGKMSDSWGYVPVIRYGAFSLLGLIFPIFLLLLNNTFLSIILFFMGIAAAAGLFLGPMNAFLNGLFPSTVRYTGVAFGYNVGAGVLGGSMPLICSYVMKHVELPFFPAFYLMTLVFLAVMAISFYKK